jgi:hypothetical protein
VKKKKKKKKKKSIRRKMRHKNMQTPIDKCDQYEKPTVLPSRTTLTVLVHDVGGAALVNAASANVASANDSISLFFKW